MHIYIYTYTHKYIYIYVYIYIFQDLFIYFIYSDKARESLPTVVVGTQRPQFNLL